jgi:hypothetical protein
MSPPVHFDGLRDFIINRKVSPGERNKIFEGWYFFGTDNDWHILPRYANASGFNITRDRSYTHNSILSSVQLVPSPPLSWPSSYYVEVAATVNRNRYHRWCTVAGPNVNPQETKQYEYDTLSVYGAVMKCPIYLNNDPDNSLETFWKYNAPSFGSGYYTTSNVTIERGCKKDNPTVNYNVQYTPVEAASWGDPIDTSIPNTTDTVVRGYFSSNTPSAFSEKKMYFIVSSGINTPSTDNERMWYFLLSRRDYRTGRYFMGTVLFPVSYEVGDYAYNNNAFYKCHTAYTGGYIASKWTNVTGNVFNAIMNNESLPWDVLEPSDLRDEPIYGIYCVNGNRNIDDGDYVFIPELENYQMSSADLEYDIIGATPGQFLYMNKKQKTKIYGNGWPS